MFSAQNDPPTARFQAGRSLLRSRPGRWVAAFTALAASLILPALAAAPAQAADDWILGSTKSTTIINCPSVVLGTPYTETGITMVMGYHGTRGVSPKVGQQSYLNVFAKLMGSHCSAPIISPRFILPAGVSFDKTVPLECIFVNHAGVETRVTKTSQCPGWSGVDSSGRLVTTESGWASGFPLAGGPNWTNGSSWEFHVPIKATSAQSGSNLSAAVQVADGNDGPTLNLSVPFYTGAGSTTPTVPGAPTGVSATATSASTASVRFTPPTNNGGAPITGYTSICTSSDGGVQRTGTGTASPIAMTGLTSGKKYSCTVAARNSAGTGATSSASAVITMPAGTAPTVPGAPTGVSATATSSTSMSVKFTPPTNTGGSPIISYDTRCTSPDGGVTATETGIASSPVTVTGLTPARKYTCQVGAKNNQGAGAWSTASAVVTMPSTTTTPTVPSAPTNVAVTVKSTTSASVTWTAPANNGGKPIDGYSVTCPSTDGGAQGYDQYVTGSPYLMTGLTPGKTYTCSVKALNDVGWSPASSSSWSFRMITTPAATVPGAPDGVSATPTSTSTASVKFTAPSNNGGAAITGYEAQCTSTNEGANSAATGTTSPVTVTGLSAGKTYRCRVRAKNSVGWGPLSSTTAAFTQPTSAPVDTTAPETRISWLSPWALTRPSIRFSSTATDVARFLCRVDGGAWKTCTSPMPATWATGSHLVQVRAVDKAGNVDRTPASTTYTAPIDDRQLRRTGRWSALRASSYYRGTAYTSKSKGATMRTSGSVRARGIALVATTCRSCGTVDVYYGNTRLKRVSLKSTSTRNRKLITIKSWSSLQSAKQIKIVVVSSGRTVRIDGVGVRTR